MMKEVDKGFEFFYKYLSNRRKFIRTIWVVLLGIFLSSYSLITVKNRGMTLTLVIIFAIFGIQQLRTTYRSYREEINRQEKSSLSN